MNELETPRRTIDEIPLRTLRSPEAETSHWEYVYGPTDEWHLTCSACGKPIYRGQEAWITEDATGNYVKAECCVPRA